MGVKNMCKGKKGFVFALITIFLVALFVFLLAIRNSHVQLEKERIMAERTEAIMVNDFTRTVNEHYLPLAVKNAAATALQAMTVYVAKTQTPITDPYTFYQDLMMNGTVESGYTTEATGYDFAMNLSARNGTTTVSLAFSGFDSGSLIYFGNTIMLAQEIGKPDAYDSLDSVEEITLSITQATAADSNDVYLLTYGDDVVTGERVLLAADHFLFDFDDGATQQITFSLDGETPLGEDDNDHYYLVLAAPFTTNTDDYSVTVMSTSDSAAYSCPSFDCDLRKWTEESTGTAIPMPIDFAIDSAVMKESFLRSMTGSLEHFGQDAFGITTDIEITSVEALEQTPWEVGATVTGLLTTEERTVAFEDVSVSAEGTVSIENMFDPYSLIYGYVDSETGPFVIVPQNITDAFDASGLQYHLSYHTYVWNENAPSYLGRFAGKDAQASTCCGIQSMLLWDHIPSSYTDADKGFSYVDYKFDNSQECSTDATNPHYLYYIVPDGSWDEIQGQQPLLDYDDVEFYHLDEMSTATYGSASCPS